MANPQPKFLAQIQNIKNTAGQFVKKPVLRFEQAFYQYIDRNYKDGEWCNLIIKPARRTRTSGQATEKSNQNGYMGS